MSRINFSLSRAEHEKSFITMGPVLSHDITFSTKVQLSLAINAIHTEVLSGGGATGRQAFRGFTGWR